MVEEKEDRDGSYGGMEGKQVRGERVASRCRRDKGSGRKKGEGG